MQGAIGQRASLNGRVHPPFWITVFLLASCVVSEVVLWIATPPVAPVAFWTLIEVGVFLLLLAGLFTVRVRSAARLTSMVATLNALWVAFESIRIFDSDPLVLGYFIGSVALAISSHLVSRSAGHSAL